MRRKSPVAFLTDAEYSALPLPERALMQARAQVGATELPRNRGFWVERFLAAVGLGPGHAWCAAFVAWCLVQAGLLTRKIPRHAGRVRSWAEWAEKSGRLRSEPRRGMLAYWLNSDGTGHIGFVADVRAIDRVRTIEGNTNKAGEREGTAVLEKWRALTVWGGFIDLEGLE